MSRQGKCAFCGLVVIADDEAQTILHEDPVCARFHELAHGGAETPEVRRVENDAVPAHLAALRARVKAQQS